MSLQQPRAQTPWRPLVQIGDIGADQHWVNTPSGTLPISQANWSMQDMTSRTREIPTYAIVLAIVTSVLTCLLGLLFLLIREERPTGWLQVTVQGPGLAHTTHLPVSSQEMVTDVYARVDYARSLTAAGRA